MALADAALLPTPDPIACLQIVQVAALLALPLPPNTAAWLRAGADAYLGGSAPTLDRALGLQPKPGAESPRNRRLEACRWLALLADVHILAALGATIPEAAHMVGTLRGASPATLASKYRRSGRRAEREVEAEALRDRLHVGGWRRSEVLLHLAQYPDDVESRRGKARIMANFPILGMHAS